YAVEQDDQEVISMREKIKEISCSHEGVVNCHGVFINLEEKRVSFDTTIDFSVADKLKMSETIRKEVEETFPGFTVAINCDTNYSD
ncbi:MAG: hypothetical protein J6Z22_05115, partial [Lachnospiraceae bacterium]|nr:hypothetical protein [Lachnospiraceae bacterium]